MRFLSVADRELRSAARRKGTYRVRWLTAVAFFLLLAWLLWISSGLRQSWAALKIFKIYSVLTFLYCLFLGAARTADCISAERREGTLGLLFLTNLNSAEIIAGKLCSSALSSVYGLLAIFPMLGLPLLMGGIPADYFARTLLALLVCILFALAAGFLASVVCKKQFPAIALAMGLTVLVAGGLLIGAVAAHSYRPTRHLAGWLAVFSPLYTLLTAEGQGFFGPIGFWQSAGAVAGLSLGWLGLATLVLARSWRDRVRTWSLSVWKQRPMRAPSSMRTAMRRRLLAINPLFWLAGRQQVSAPVFMGLIVALTLMAVYVGAPFFRRVISAGAIAPIVGYLFAWLWTGLAIHALVVYYAAMTASQQLAEDRQTGALELLLSTPVTERSISRGLWLAYARKMLFPALVAVLVHAFFLWMCMVTATLEPPGPVPRGATAGQIFWSALLNRPIRGQVMDWQFGFMLRIALLMLVQLMMVWVTLGWVGRWLGLRMKHPGFAPMGSLAFVFIPPLLLFSLACYLADKFNFDRMPERQFLPMMMWLTFAIGMGHCLALCAWAARRLHLGLRPVAMSRYLPLPAWRWRLPSRRTVRRFAIATTASAAAVFLLVTIYYGYQNWHSTRAWRAFQNGLKRNGESLSLAPLLPGPVPDSANFARSPAFRALSTGTNREIAKLLDGMSALDLQAGDYQRTAILLDWNVQSFSPLGPFVNWQPSGSGSAKRKDDATAILQKLQEQSDLLRDVAAAAARFPAFQTSTNREARAVLQTIWDQVKPLERLHLLYQARACASLALGKNTEAADDVLTGLRLARLARQLPDASSLSRVQGLLTRSLQPLWEGLKRQAWTEPQLAALQHELAEFNLLADYTNAVRRVVLANIEVWRAIPDSKSYAALSLSVSRHNEQAWRLQPRTWWFESCIQLYNGSRKLIGRVDAAAGRFQRMNNLSDFSGLPLDGPASGLLVQSWWWGSANPASTTFVQTSVNQALLACALERYRLAKGAYPETLDQLVPGFLDHIPHDTVSGRPMIYQPGGGGGFVLRGVGSNGVDDRKINPSDDWLWAYSTNAPSAKK